MRITHQELTLLVSKLDEVYDFLKEVEGGNLDDFGIMTMATQHKDILRQAIAILENLEE